MKTNIKTNNRAIAIFALVFIVAFSPLFVGTGSAFGFTQCSDGFDNNGNGLIDADDPACHTDWDASNPLSYDPNINAEQGTGPVWDSSSSSSSGSSGSCGGSCTTPPPPPPAPAPKALNVSCRVSDTRVKEGDLVSYSANISGGVAPYRISWEGDHRDLDGEHTERVRVRYNKEGRFWAQVTLRDSQGSKDIAVCRDLVVEKDKDKISPPANLPPVFTSTAPSIAFVGQSYVYHASAFDPEGKQISYSLIAGPLGLSMNPITGMIHWIPISTQGNQSHFVSIKASDGVHSSIQSFTVFVQRPIIVQPPVVRPPIPTPAPVPVAKLKIVSLRVDNDANNNAIVSFETNIPASGSVAYSLVSHASDDNANNYGNRVNGFNQTTFHQINLGQLEINRTYYLRAIASTSNDSDITAELAFVQLPAGVILGETEIITDDRAVLSLASAFAILFAFLFHPGLLLLIIIILLLLILLRGRDRDRTIVAPTSGPVRIQS